MRLSPDDQKKIAAVAAFVVIAAGLVYFEYFDTGTPAAPATTPAATTAPATEGAPARAENTVEATPAIVAGRAAKPVGTTSSSLDPTLHMEAMLVSESVQYSGSGRNIFSPNSAPPPVVIPKPVAGPRNVAQVAPPPVIQQGPAPPPPIDLKFFGFETTANGKRQAFLLHNDDVYLASAGDIVLRRYRVITIDAKTIQVEDMQNKNTQTLPLLAN
jgi:hypothetical protein